MFNLLQYISSEVYLDVFCMLNFTLYAFVIFLVLLFSNDSCAFDIDGFLFKLLDKAFQCIEMQGI